MSGLGVYLFFYNGVMCGGWTIVLFRLLHSFLHNTSSYSSVIKPLLLFQTSALLECIHALTGLVRSSVLTTLLQISSRVMLSWGVSVAVPGVRSHWAFSSMVCAWALTEIPRYFYFAVAAVAAIVPRWLGWMRYSTFLPLYPIGAGSEWIVLYNALPYIKREGILSVELPNRWNFEFDYYRVCIVVLVLYVPGLPHMYGHMIRQRRKYLTKSERPKVA